MYTTTLTNCGVTADKEFTAYHKSETMKGWGRDVHDRKRFQKFFREIREEQDKHEKMFEQHPVFVAYRVGRKGLTQIIFNDLLRKYEFMRVKDPYTAFQELFMYMSNLAKPEKPMPVIADEMKIQAHGMNKWSFRRPPGG